MNKKEAIRRHRELWNKIADLSLEQKRCVRKWEIVELLKQKPSNMCWCCEYAYSRFAEERSSSCLCEFCPVVWGGDRSKECYDDFTEYRRLILSASFDDYEKYAKLAREIANLPERLSVKLIEIKEVENE